MQPTEDALPIGTAASGPRREFWVFRGVPLLAGLAQGATVCASRSLPHPQPDWQDALIFSILAAGLVIQATWPSGDRPPAARVRCLAAAVLAGLLLGLCDFWTSGAWEDADVAPSALLLTPALFIALPWLHGVVVGGFRIPAYERLFDRAADLVLAMLIGLLCLGIFLLLLMLWRDLFDLLKLTEATSLLGNPAVSCFGGAIAWTLGILAARERSGILDRLLKLCSVLARGLLPFAVLIGSTFFLALPFTGLEPVWRQGGSGLLLAIAGASAMFINGVYQSGSQDYAAWQKRLVEAAILMVAVAVGLAAYGTTLRIRQYGLTPDRVLLIAFVLFAAVVAAGYTASVIPGRGPWLHRVGKTNRLALPAMVLLLIALTSPVLDPVRLSAWSQYHRVADGLEAPEFFDFAYLQFRLGPAGRERLAELEALDDHPQATVIRARIADARNSMNYWSWRRGDFQSDGGASAPQVQPEPASQPTPVVPAELPLESVSRVIGPLALHSRVAWQAGDLPRLYVVMQGDVLFSHNTSPNAEQRAAVFRAAAGEMTYLNPNGRAAILIVEIGPAP